MKKITLLTALVFLFTTTITAQSINWEWLKTNQSTSALFNYASIANSSGEIYVTGQFHGQSITFGNTTLTKTSSSPQVYIVKYNAEGNVLWARTFNSQVAFRIASIALNSNGDIIIAGSYRGSVLLDSFEITTPSPNDYFVVAKLSSAGSVSWVRTAGGPDGFPVSHAISIDSMNNIFVSGAFTSESFSISEDISLQRTGFSHVFVAKYSSDGLPLWAKKNNYSSSVYHSQPTSLSTDSDGNSYVSGPFGGTCTFEGNAVSTTSLTSSYLAKFSASGNVQFVKKYGGYLFGTKIKFDSQDNLYMTGGFANAVTLGQTNLTATGNADIFLSKLNSNGDVLWARKAGGTFAEIPYDIAIGGNAIYIGGYFTSSTLAFGTITLTNPMTVDVNGPSSSFVAKYDMQGNVLEAGAPVATGMNTLYSVCAAGNFAYCSGNYINDFTLGNTMISSANQNIFVARLNTAPLSNKDFLIQPLAVFPNPAKDILNIKSEKLLNSDYVIFDSTGRNMQHGSIGNNSIDITALLSGIYILSTNGINTKFIKE